MAISVGIARNSIGIGCTLLGLTFVSVICGAVAMGKMPTSPLQVSVGLWALYFVIPGVLAILSGYKKLPSMLGVALGTHVLGILVAIVGMACAGAFWSTLESSCAVSFQLNNGRCACIHHYSISYYKASCSDLKAVRNATATITIVFAFLTIVSFVASIQGCVGTCCAPQEPVVVVATQFPVQPNAMIVTNSQQQAHFMQPGQFAHPAPQPFSQALPQPVQAYSQPPPGYHEPAAVGQLEHGNADQVIDCKK